MKKALQPYSCMIVFLSVLSLFTCTVCAINADVLSDETLLTDTEDLPYYLRDRGTGLSTSMFGTYITKGQIYFYPFVEHYRDTNMEYSPDEFGYNQVKDYRGDYRANEALIFFGYGISDRIAVEFEAAVISATLERAGDDNSGMPKELKESGLGDVEGQIRWRWKEENENRPEVFSYFETVLPLRKSKVLIGTQDWEYKFGMGVTKGFRFGTVTFRVATEYDRSEEAVELGEYAFEYLRKISSRWRVYGGMEGNADEIEAITEVQCHLNRTMFFKFNNAFGVTSNATGWAPEIGMVFAF